MAVIPFPGFQPKPEDIPDPIAESLAAAEVFGQSLIAAVGDRTVGEALEQLARQPAKDILEQIFTGWTSGGEQQKPPPAQTTS
jgi:hypothetical protein